MQSESLISRPPKSRWLRLASAFALAFCCVLFAYHQLKSMDRDPHPASAFKGAGSRGPTPDFWLRDHAAGRAEAQQTGKPIFLVIRCEP